MVKWRYVLDKALKEPSRREQYTVRKRSDHALSQHSDTIALFVECDISSCNSGILSSESPPLWSPLVDV